MANEEKRGWEINNQWTKHWLDDPFYDMAEDEMSDNRYFWLWLAFSVLLVAGYVFWPESKSLYR